ncbi:MAG: transcriptional regulator [Faecalibacterium sp.]|nr:transcriptional regulator [Faecalibacterium sp.]
MPRKEGQKAKILILLQILEQNTDETHRMTVPQLAAALEAQGVPCERKSIYTDIAALQQMGYDIEMQRGPGGGYYMASRSFQLPELKLLVDAVQSSRFITQRKSRELIKKLESLASKHQASLLSRQVYVAGRAKSDNESAYYSVDTLHEAINSGKMVQFTYSKWGPDKKKHPRNEGKPYQVSPWALVWENNGYYLIAYQDYAQPANIRHYRVDKMSRVKILDQARRGQQQFRDFDLSAYLQQMFNMFGAKQVHKVTLRCHNSMADAMLDRFGTGVTLMEEEDGAHFHFTVPVAVSPQFLGWVCGFGDLVQITGPDPVVQEMRQLAQALAGQYL